MCGNQMTTLSFYGHRDSDQVWWRVPLLASCSQSPGIVGTQVGGVLELFSLIDEAPVALGCVQSSGRYTVRLLSAACLGANPRSPLSTLE